MCGQVKELSLKPGRCRVPVATIRDVLTKPETMKRKQILFFPRPLAPCLQGELFLSPGHKAGTIAGPKLGRKPTGC